MGPLTGIRVLDLTNVLVGPFCCHQLAHMGAELIKVEVPGKGDLARQLGADHDLNAAGMGVSFLAQNSGKRSITLNLKTERGKDILRKLASSADVLVENFRPGVMDRLGLGPDSLRAENPELIYCAITGFGQDGPLSDAPAYDQIIQGVSGVMSITGYPDGGPTRVGYPVADTVGGMTAAFAIAAALAKPKPGRGTTIDVSMLDSMLSTMGWVVSNHLMADQNPQRMGNDNFTASPSGVFQARDKGLNIAANKQEHFEDLVRLVGRAELATDPRFATRKNRLLHRAELKAELDDAMSTRDATDWVRLFTEHSVPAGEILDLPQALAHPQVADRDFVATFDAEGVDRPVKIARPGFLMDGKRPATQSPPPAIGAETNAILHELGLSPDDIETLRKEGTI